MNIPEIRFQQVTPISQLRGYIDKIWIFESSAPMPRDDMKLVVPNGRLLLIIPFRNGLTGQMDDKYYVAPQHKMALVGMSDRPSIVDAEMQGPTGTIGVEISAIGAYRFFHLRLKDITNQLHPLEEIVGKTVATIEQQILEVQGIGEKVNLLQQFLLSLFIYGEKDSLFEYCIQQIKTAKGIHSIRQLERATGYTGRWLNVKFEERLGISPKNYSSIMRFQRYYSGLLADPHDFFKEKSFYDDYYDESHFVKDFKRFTDMPPARMMRSKNDFGKTFYQD